MPSTLTFCDRSTDGRIRHESTIDFLTDRVTVRELIRSRVYQEVQDYNLHASGVFHGLVQPPSDDRRGKTQIDWQVQFDLALQAFKWRQVLVLIDDRQLEDLETEIDINPGTRVTFLRLVPLVGG